MCESTQAFRVLLFSAYVRFCVSITCSRPETWINEMSPGTRAGVRATILSYGPNYCTEWCKPPRELGKKVFVDPNPLSNRERLFHNVRTTSLATTSELDSSITTCVPEYSMDLCEVVPSESRFGGSCWWLRSVEVCLS